MLAIGGRTTTLVDSMQMRKMLCTLYLVVDGSYVHRQEIHAMSPLVENQSLQRIFLPTCPPIWCLNMSLPTYLSCYSYNKGVITTTGNGADKVYANQNSFSYPNFQQKMKIVDINFPQTKNSLSWYHYKLSVRHTSQGN